MDFPNQSGSLPVGGPPPSNRPDFVALKTPGTFDLIYGEQRCLGYKVFSVCGHHTTIRKQRNLKESSYKNKAV